MNDKRLVGIWVGSGGVWECTSGNVPLGLLSVGNILYTQVRHDSLDLRVPVWVTEVGFTPASGAQPTVAVGTGYHQV